MASLSVTEKLLKELEQQRFYGSVEFKFESGHLVLIRKTETMKPQDYRNSRGTQDENSR